MGRAKHNPSTADPSWAKEELGRKYGTLLRLGNQLICLLNCWQSFLQAQALCVLGRPSRVLLSAGARAWVRRR